MTTPIIQSLSGQEKKGQDSKSDATSLKDPRKGKKSLGTSKEKSKEKVKMSKKKANKKKKQNIGKPDQKGKEKAK